MRYDRMPLYPPACDHESCVRMQLFDGCGCAPCLCGDCCRIVRMENPACPGELAEVHLSVDDCGCLNICVHRPPRPCGPRPIRPHKPPKHGRHGSGCFNCGC